MARFKLLKCRLFKLFGKLQLETIIIGPSHKCNADCVHCYEKFNDKAPSKNLSTEQVKDIADQFCALGGYYILFCSGEFLLRNDALELVRYARSTKAYVGLTTNGLLLDEKKIDDLIEAGLTHTFVSLDSANPLRHDKLRGVPGCFEKATNGLRLARKKGLITQLWTYVSRSNLEELERLTHLAEELKVEYIYVYFTLLSGKFFNRFEENLTFEEREMLRKKYNRNRYVKLEFPKENSPCKGGGFRHISVTPTGDITFCPPVPYSYGNINQKLSLQEGLNKINRDYKRFNCGQLGQCPVNFMEYRQNCNADFVG